MTMIHAVIGQDSDENILQIITCFNKDQIPFATKNIKNEYPNAIISVRSTPDDKLGQQ